MGFFFFSFVASLWELLNEMEWFLKSMLSASDTLKHWPWFRGDDKDWDGADGGPRVIKNGMEPVSWMEFDLDTELNQYKRQKTTHTIRQINAEYGGEREWDLAPTSTVQSVVSRSFFQRERLIRQPQHMRTTTEDVHSIISEVLFSCHYRIKLIKLHPDVMLSWQNN